MDNLRIALSWGSGLDLGLNAWLSPLKLLSVSGGDGSRFSCYNLHIVLGASCSAPRASVRIECCLGDFN